MGAEFKNGCPPEQRVLFLCTREEQEEEQAAPLSLRNHFYKEERQDPDAQPVGYEGLEPHQRAALHEEADLLDLYRETVRTARGNILVIGSMKNGLAKQRVYELMGTSITQFSNTFLGGVQRGNIIGGGEDTVRRGLRGRRIEL